MFALNRANTLWLPAVSLFLFLYTSLLLLSDDAVAGLLAWLGPVLALPLIAWGLALALKGSGVDFPIFFKRPANVVTLIRSALLLAGITTASICLSEPQKAVSPPLRILAAAIIVLAFLGDKVDGFLARREKKQPKAAGFGSWYDAESDAIIILFAGVLAVHRELAPAALLVAVLARYVFGLLFAFFPLPLVTTVWFARFSKITAGFLQGVLGYIWGAALLFSGAFSPFHRAPLFFTHPAPAAAASYIISAIIFLSFVLETWYRFRTFFSTMPPKFRKGLLRSFLIYYRVPFRYTRMVKFYRGCVTPGDTVFDVGAHLGNRIRAFRALGARVIAFEPQESCKKILETWFGSDKSVVLDYSAVGNENGSVALSTSYKNPTLASVDGSWIRKVKREPGFKGVQWENRSIVPLISLEAAIEKYGTPQFLKIDAEGSEAAILEGLSRAVKVLSFEFLPSCADRALACIRLVERLGRYEFNFSKGETMRLRYPDWLNAEEIDSFIREYPKEGKSGDVYARLATKI